MPWYKQSGAFQRRAAVNHQLRWPFARGDGELPLLKAGKSTILGLKPPEFGECRLKRVSNGAGIGSCRRAVANNDATKGSKGGEAVVAGRLTDNVALPGMQISLQTSQDASAVSVICWRSATDFGAVIGTSRSTTLV